MASSMTADESMLLLDRLFQRFDTLTSGAFSCCMLLAAACADAASAQRCCRSAAAHGIYKTETSGARCAWQHAWLVALMHARTR
jgi:hypothetical protein